MVKGMIILITGPSGAGKTTFVERLMAENPRLAFSVSSTTRPPRSGEVDGKDYFFIDEPEFDRLLAAEAFVEWAVVHGHRYGTLRSQLEELVQARRLPLLDIDVQGGRQVIKAFGPELVSVFLFPPSWQELERRLRSRNTDAPEEVARRLQTARQEVGAAPLYRYWIVNDDLEAALARMQAIITAEECRREAYPAPPLTAS